MVHIKNTDKYIHVDDFLIQKCSSIKEFIPKEPYLSFLLVSIGIEFIGKCLDGKHGFDEYSKDISKAQYNMAINRYFRKYRSLYLQHNLRNKMSHSLIPDESLWLRTKDGTSYEHLSTHEIHGVERTVIVIEELFNDFQTACYSLIESMDKGEFESDDKIYRPILVHEEN